MTSGQAIAFLLFAVVAAMTPGPSNLILTSTGGAVGVRRGLPTLVGQVVEMELMLFLVAFGLRSLVLKSPLIIQGLTWCGSGFLLWLTMVKMVQATDRRTVQESERHDRRGRGRKGTCGGATYE